MADKPRIRDAGGAAAWRSRRDQRQGSPSEADPATGTDAGEPETTPGQLALDDRGNVSWEWSDDPDLLADDILGSTARLRALAPKDLSIEDQENELAAVSRDAVQPRRPQQSGYNPYESGGVTKKSWKKKRDLRELDKWIALKKRMQNKTGED